MSIVNVIVKDISASPYLGEDDIFSIAEKKLIRSNLPLKPLGFSIYRKSVDARKKEDIKLVYSINVTCEASDDLSKERIVSRGFSVFENTNLDVSHGKEKMSGRPLVVGFGPAGMFCAMLLAEHGYRPIVIERGDDVDTRLKKKAEFYLSHRLDTESNVQFGAGGAGTFSDGKLVTRINDPACSYVLSLMHRLGAPDEILYKAKPHVGTDKLLDVVRNAHKRITELGGEVLYRERLEHINFNAQGDVVSVMTNIHKELDCGAVVLCTGHSARDTYRMLMSLGVCMTPKPFSVGVRIEHLRADIDRAMYGDESLSEILGPAEYNLSYNTKSRGVYTFCMCPGGEVVAATSEEGGVVVNGMSNYGSTADGAINFQSELEKLAYSAGGGDYRAPVTLLSDFFDRTGGKEPQRVMPTYMNGTNYKLCNFSAFMPEFMYMSLRDGLTAFDRKINGFSASDAVLSAFETRTSAPVRVLRNESRNAIGHSNMFPCGEGAGYAGGITSAAVDGLKTSIEIMRRYAPHD